MSGTLGRAPEGATVTRYKHRPRSRCGSCGDVGHIARGGECSKIGEMILLVEHGWTAKDAAAKVGGNLRSLYGSRAWKEQQSKGAA